MKLAILCLVVVGLIALSETAPVEQPSEVALVAGENSEAQMNELADPDCGGDGESGEGDGSTAEAKQAKKDKRKGKKGKGGKGKKKEQTESEATE